MPDKENEKKEAKELPSKEELKDLVEMLGTLLDAYGHFAESLGEIQKNHEEAYNTMFSLELAEKIPDLLSQVSEKGPPKLGKLLTGIFIKMSTISPRIGKLMDLSADDKLKLGKNLKSVAKDIYTLHSWIEKMEEE